MRSNSDANGVLWVTPHDPWSPWTMSGVSSRLCNALAERHALAGAISPDSPSTRNLYGQRRRSLLDLAKKRLSPRNPTWGNESDGIVGNVLRTLPEGTPVVYVFHKPKPDPALQIRRFRCLDLSIYDAIRHGVFGYAGMSAECIQTAIDAERESLRHTDGVLAMSTYAADAISRDLGYPREKITPIGAGPTFYVSEVNLFSRRRYEAGRVLFVGRDWQRKGGPLLLEAMTIVRQSVPHATLHVVGPPTCPADHPWLIYHPPINKATRRGLLALKRLFTASSVFCMPTTCEPWGLVFSEAAETGLPIIAFPEWSLPDIVEHGVTGLFVSNREPCALADALVWTLANPEEGMRMGQAARQRCRDILDWPHVASRLLRGVNSQRGSTPRDCIECRPLQSSVQCD